MSKKRGVYELKKNELGPGPDLAWPWSSEVQAQVRLMTGLVAEGQVQVWKKCPGPGPDQTLDSLFLGHFDEPLLLKHDTLT